MKRFLSNPKDWWYGQLCFATGLSDPTFFSQQWPCKDSDLEMLRDFFIPELKRLRRHSTTYFQQDGAPPHWGLNVREFLNTQFPDRWIGRNGPIHWPARSPDLTPLDYFLWAISKTLFTRIDPSTIKNYRTRYLTQFNPLRKKHLTELLKISASAWISVHR